MSEKENSSMQDYIKNISNISNKVKHKVKENFTKFFKKENNKIMNTKNSGINSFSSECSAHDEFSSPQRSTFTKTESENQENKKQVFIIEEDEEHKVYNYNLDTYEDDDYDDYVEELDEDSSTQNVKQKFSEEKIKNDEVKTSEILERSEEKLNEKDEIEEIDPHTICHKLYTKGELIDLEGTTFFKCVKMKENLESKIFSFIGIKKNEKINLKEEKYKILVENNFIYFLKDKIHSEKKINFNNFVHASKPYSLKTLSTVEFKILDSNNRSNYTALITLLFILDKNLDNYKSKIKKLYFNLDEYTRFIKYMREMIIRLKLPVKI